MFMERRFIGVLDINICGILKSMLSRISKTILILATFAFLWVAFFGLSHSLNDMKVKSDGTMNGCLFDGKAEICTMSFAEHIDHWQAMFTTIPAKATTISFAILLLVSFIFAFSLRKYLLLLSTRLSELQRIYLRHMPEFSLFEPLQLAFSRGILNPKIF